MQALWVEILCGAAIHSQIKFMLLIGFGTQAKPDQYYYAIQIKRGRPAARLCPPVIVFAKVFAFPLHLYKELA